MSMMSDDSLVRAALKLAPLTAEDREILRTVQLRAGARAYAGQRVLDIAKRAFREARDVVELEQLRMRQGDAALIDLDYYARGRVAGHVMARIKNRADVADYSRVVY